MTRRNEDFDEFCDPENPRIINYKDVVEAARRMKPLLVHPTIVPSKFQKHFTSNILYKPEILQKSGSFKERGSLNVLQLLPPDKKKIGLVIASNGNEAAGLCIHASKLGVPVVVVMPISVSLAKIHTCQSYGAKVVVQGANLMDAQKYARAISRDKGLTYINMRDHPHVLAGYGTVALEILEEAPTVDAVLVPVGSGGLAAAVLTVIKHDKPNCLVYGVQCENSPGFFKSLEREQPLVMQVMPNIADAIAIPNVGYNAFANTLPLLDKMLLVKEDWIARAMLHFMEKEKFVVEGAAACTLAAYFGSLVPELKLKNVVCILTGGNVGGAHLSRCMERALAAEACLLKFTVAIKDDTKAKAQLFELLTSGGYGLINHVHERRWTLYDSFYVEVDLVCQTKGLEHALELKRIVDKAYPNNTVYHTEPFNDKRTCPCYVKKGCQ